MRARYPKPAVLDRIRADRHAVIEASAGTGKTYTLEHLVLDRILGGTEVTSILVLTFTEKAATEMRERIRALLRRLAALPDGAGPEDPDEACWVIDEDARRRIRAALESFDSATISTIHAFCNGLLGEQAFANRRLFEQETVDARSLFSAAFVEVIREAVRDEEVCQLIQWWLQESSIEELESFLFECHRAPGRLEPPFDEERVRALFEAFPRGASDALAEAWNETKRRTGSQRRTSTLVDRYQQIEGIVEQLGENATELDRLKTGWAIGKLERSKKTHLEEILSFLDEMVDPPGEVRALRDFCRDLPKVLPSLEALLAGRLLPHVEACVDRIERAEGLLDFDDMLRAVRETLESPEGGELVQSLRQRFRYAILDEFQDTDEVQWAIFRKLFFEGEGGNVLYAIGDPKQAIYGFRGADVGTYLVARKEIVARGGNVVVLHHCFRATESLIAAYNRIFDQKATEPFFSGAIRYDEPVQCGRPALRLVGPGGDPATPIHVFVAKEGLSADAMLERWATETAREIRRIVRPEDPSLLWDEGEGPRPLAYRDVYVLYRKVAEGKAIAEVLRAHGIPFAFYKEEGLFQRPEAWAWHDLLRALAAPDEPTLQLRAWLSPFFGVTLADLSRAREVPTDHPLRTRLAEWAELAQARDWERLIPRVLDGSGILRRAIAKGDERALTNYLHLGELILERAHRQSPSCEELADWLQALIEKRALPERENGNQQRLETDRDAVQLMTMHAAKGLEAPVVFVLGKLTAARQKGWLTRYRDAEGNRCFWVGTPPEQVQQSSQREEREEAERLLYVALTRAKARLYLPYAENREGDFTPLLERLDALRQEGAEGFEWREVEAEPTAFSAGGALGAVDWDEPEVEDEAAAFAELRRGHMGFVITSYSRMRGFRGAEEEEERIEGERMVVEPGPDELPGGPATGIFLHDVLARIPREEVPATFADFRAAPALQQLFEEAGRAHGIAAQHLDHAWRLVWNGLRTPLSHGALALPGGVVDADRWRTEMEFLYPFPAHAVGTELRGFVKGFVDLVFEADGRIHFADWKSDCLPSFDAAYLRSYVKGSYELQLRLYAIAIRKLFRLDTRDDWDARFGGAFYFFLRGMEKEGSAGIYFERPSFEDVVRWERELEKA